MEEVKKMIEEILLNYIGTNLACIYAFIIVLTFILVITFFDRSEPVKRAKADEK